MTSEHSPLSVFRFCPRCGSPDFGAASEKSLECSGCGFVYYFNMASAVAALIRNEEGEILFTLRRHAPAAGMLDLPGGFVDPGETAEQALIREIREELNLEVTAITYRGSFTNRYLYGGLEYQTLDLVFDCRVLTLETLQAADDVAGWVFRNPSEVKAEEIGLESIRRIVKTVSVNDRP
jgi:NAD+ diphosphatase